MGPGARLVAAAAWLAVAGAALDKQFNITVGYLPALRHGQGLTISGAITTALEELNNSTEILPDVRILLEWRNTNFNWEKASQLLTNMSRSGAVAFFGPEGRCSTDSPEVQARNLPVISYKCSDSQTTLSNFARLEQPDEQAAKAVLSLLRYYRWNKFSLLYGEEWELAARTLETHAKRNNMTINHQRAIIDSAKCCEEELACCTPGFWFSLIRDTKDKTRIYVLMGSESELSDMMSAMETHQLFDRGLYMVIFVDVEQYDPKRTYKYWMDVIEYIDNNLKIACPVTPALKKRAQSLLVVTLPEPTSSFEALVDEVRRHNKIEPFNFPDGNFQKHVSIYGAYLYDSVMMYANALDDLIKEATQTEALSYDKLMSIATNGSRIVAKMIEKTPYKSVSGMTMRLDDSVSSQNKFAVLALNRVGPSDDFNCSLNMVPVGYLQQNTREYPKYKLNPRLPIEWVGGVKPEDEPCFNNASPSQISSTNALLSAMFYTKIVVNAMYYIHMLLPVL